MAKNLPANAGDIRDMGLIPGLGRSSREGNGNPFQFSCLEKSHGQRSLVDYSPLATKSQTQLSTPATIFFFNIIASQGCVSFCYITK